MEIFLSNKNFLYYDLEWTDGKIGTEKLEIITQCSLIVADLKYKKIKYQEDLIIDDNFNINHKFSFYKKIIDILYTKLLEFKCILIFFSKNEDDINKLVKMSTEINEEEYTNKVNTIKDKIFNLYEFYSKSNEFFVQIEELEDKSALKYLSKYKNKKSNLEQYDDLGINSGKEVNLETFKWIKKELNYYVWLELKDKFKKYCHNDVEAMINQVLNLIDLYNELNQ